MMKKKAFYWAFSLFAVSLISCNQEIDESIKKLELDVAQSTRSLNIVKEDTLVQNYEFLYKGKLMKHLYWLLMIRLCLLKIKRLRICF